jgi:Transglutaminase-like superfamily
MGATLWSSRPVVAIRRHAWPWLAPAGLVWADTALRHVRRRLDTDGLRVRIPPPPRSRLPLAGLIDRWLLWRGATCLERSLVMQRWLLAAGEPHQLIIGVEKPGDTVMAHAWLDHEDSRGYLELLTLDPLRPGVLLGEADRRALGPV